MLIEGEEPELRWHSEECESWPGEREMCEWKQEKNTQKQEILVNNDKSLWNKTAVSSCQPLLIVTNIKIVKLYKSLQNTWKSMQF